MNNDLDLISTELIHSFLREIGTHCMFLPWIRFNSYFSFMFNFWMLLFLSSLLDASEKGPFFIISSFMPSLDTGLNKSLFFHSSVIILKLVTIKERENSVFKQFIDN